MAISPPNSPPIRLARGPIQYACDIPTAAPVAPIINDAVAAKP